MLDRGRGLPPGTGDVRLERRSAREASGRRPWFGNPLMLVRGRVLSRGSRDVLLERGSSCEASEMTCTSAAGISGLGHQALDREAQTLHVFPSGQQQHRTLRPRSARSAESAEKAGTANARQTVIENDGSGYGSIGYRPQGAAQIFVREGFVTLDLECSTQHVAQIVSRAEVIVFDDHDERSAGERGFD